MNKKELVFYLINFDELFAYPKHLTKKPKKVKIGEKYSLTFKIKSLNNFIFKEDGIFLGEL